MHRRLAMYALPELQRRFAGALLDGGAALALADVIAPGRVPLARQLAVHRNTVRGGLTQALRLRYPTLARLVGEAFFDQAALGYAAADWPRAPQLDAWGAGFADFVGAYAPAAAWPWLHDVARLDALLDALGALRDDGASRDWPAVALAGQAGLALAPSLRLLAVTHAADELRAAVMAGETAVLADVDLASRPIQLVAWRDGANVKTRRVGVAAGTFLAELRAGSAPESALAAAITTSGASAADVLAALQREVFSAPFAAVRAPAAPSPRSTAGPTP
ncbi:MAG: DNA-binding domain-containing protein [Steroidobacteraceae bacterium]